MADLKQALGAHDVKVKKITLAQEDSGFISIGVQVEFQDGERGWKYVNNKTDKGLQHMRKTLKAIGFDMDKHDLGILIDNPDTLIDAECEAVVGENDWNGRVTNRIDWLNPIRKKPSKEALSSLTKALREVKKGDEIPTVVPDQDGGL